MAERIRLQRKKGWRKPEGAVVVARPSRWGNPWRIGKGMTREESVARFTEYIRVRRDPPDGWTDKIGYPADEEIRRELKGRDLACWCPLPEEGRPDVCHAAVLLKIASGVDEV
ncbi:DUF4326 domain-containing protein [Spirillospora sp. NPDC029432]|uniref:DUF4326 domain-containing protein n=1 Tax=Spirillospora sp. NPDC029432 TaxID=3154599 RepID=UPI0034554A4F